MKSLLVNSCFNSGKQVVAIIVAFVAAPIIVHTLGDERYGVWSLIVSITGYFSFLEFGVATAVVKYVSHFSAQNDRERRKSVLAASRLLERNRNYLRLYFAVCLTRPTAPRYAT